MEFRSLEDCSFDTLFDGFARAFADYEIRFDKSEVRAMLQRRGYNPRLSFAMFDKGDIVAFTFNGVGEFGNLPTAYDTGTGTVREYRGMGLAAEIFSRALPYLREYGIRQYLLEVLQTNEKAIAVYRKLGFETVREFDCFRQSVGEVAVPVSTKAPGCEILPIDIDTVASANCFGDFIPSWQNSIASLRRGADGLTFLGAYTGGEPAGYCVFDPLTGDIAQIAVNPGYRRRGIGTRLMSEALGGMRSDIVKVLNVCSADTTVAPFLESINIPRASRQYEMLMRL